MKNNGIVLEIYKILLLNKYLLAFFEFFSDEMVHILTHCVYYRDYHARVYFLR